MPHATDETPVELTPDASSTPAARVCPPSGPDEALVPDRRAALRPAQMVERKLHGLLRNTPLPISHLHGTCAGLSRRRS